MNHQDTKKRRMKAEKRERERKKERKERRISRGAAENAEKTRLSRIYPQMNDVGVGLVPTGATIRDYAYCCFPFLDLYY